MQTAVVGIVPHTKTLIRCVICGVIVPKAVKCIEQHGEGTKHIENLRIMGTNGIIFKDLSLHCKPCGQPITGDSVQEHIDGYEHNNWLFAMDEVTAGEFIKYDAYLTLQSEDAQCELCDSPLACSLDGVRDHVKSVEHRTNLLNLLRPGNGMLYVNDDNQVWCKICNLHFDNNINILMDHIENNTEHMQWMIRVEDLIQEQDVSIKEFLIDENETKAYCNKCNVQITCSPLGIEAHVESESHLLRVL